jgi:hypothetical protein
MARIYNKSFDYDLNHSLQISDHTFIQTGTNMQEYKTTHPYFNYFNRIQILTDDHSVYAFFCKRDDNSNFYLYREIELVISKLLNIFGVDSENKGAFHLGEIQSIDESKPIRQWLKDKIIIQLLTSTIASGNYVVLTLNEMKR